MADESKYFTDEHGRMVRAYRSPIDDHDAWYAVQGYCPKCGGAIWVSSGDRSTWGGKTPVRKCENCEYAEREAFRKEQEKEKPRREAAARAAAIKSARARARLEARREWFRSHKTGVERLVGAMIVGLGVLIAVIANANGVAGNGIWGIVSGVLIVGGLGGLCQKQATAAGADDRDSVDFLTKEAAPQFLCEKCQNLLTRVAPDVLQCSRCHFARIVSPSNRASIDPRCPRCEFDRGWDRERGTLRLWNGIDCPRCGYHKPAEPEVPVDQTKKDLGSCPRCGFGYRWDGSHCSHCGYDRAGEREGR